MNKIGKIFIICGLLLIKISLTLLSVNYYQDYTSGKKSSEALTIFKDNLEKTQKEETDSTIIEYENKEMPITNINGIDYLGSLIIPNINLELPIISEYDTHKLNIAPCRYYGSIYTNDLIICGHSYKNHFKNLINLNQGNIIIFTDVFGKKYYYEVLEIEILNPEDVEEMINNEFDLTLYTCTNDGLKRVTIRCNRINDKI